MGAIGDYIHYQYSNFTGATSPEANTQYLYSIYTQQRIEQQYDYALENLKEKLRDIYLSKINNISTNSIGEEEFFTLLDDIQKNVLTKAAATMTSKLQTTNVGYADLQKLDQDAERLQEVINIFKTILEQITNGSFSQNPIAILTQEMLQGDMSVSKIKDTFRQAYLTDGTTFKVDESYSRAVKSHQNEINKMLAGLSALKSIQEGSMKNFDNSIKSQVINSFIMSIWSTLNRIIGFVSEDVLADALPGFLAKELKGLNNIISVSTEGTQSGSIFNVKTEDISLHMDLNKMLEQTQDGQITVNLPGVTLKRTNIKNNQIAKVHIKSNALLSNFLDNMNLNTNLIDFYHAYADYNMAIKKKKGKALPAELNKSAANAMINMYNYFHAAMLPMALAGSLTYDDFAYFMVINDKVFNVIEIIQKIADNDDFSFVTSNLSTSQTGIKNAHNQYYQIENDPTSNIEGETRSAYIRNKIRSLNVTLQLILSLDKNIKNRI